MSTPLHSKLISGASVSLSQSTDRTRPPAKRRRVVAESQEVLIVDVRAAMTPADMVEQKLLSLVKDAWLPVSHLRGRGAIRPPPG